MLIDARGLGCPKPVMMAEEGLNSIEEGTVDVLVDNEASSNNVVRFAKKSGLYAETQKIDNYWKIKIVKGFQCSTQPNETSDTDKSLFLVVAGHAIGRDEELGKILMKGMFETMKVTGEIPNSIFFLNTGVKITTSDNEILQILKGLEGMGVEIFSCGTCLKHYGLEDSLLVGFRGTTNHLVEGMKDFKKTVWIG
ncbi:MAG: sulfurtransferase-like selenium metabolism protein YedF [Candidatus Magnetoovum sp. WYHC-5]|nr:sulfurtransferase-like selenium metabolism protein YedF [Candidatus Magnetoovum sp. WYHC-5]